MTFKDPLQPKLFYDSTMILPAAVASGSGRQDVPLVKGAGKELCLINMCCWTPAQGSAWLRVSQSLSCAPSILQDTKVKKRASGEHCYPMLIPDVQREEPWGLLVFQPCSTVRGWVNY